MNHTVRNTLALLLMVGAATLAWALRPTISLADELPPINLEAMVPKAFGEWKELPQTNAQVVNPQLAETIDRLYSQTLTRVYAHPSGYRVMLSIAYGKNQSDALQVHKPEVCYPAQGFALLGQRWVVLKLDDTNLPAKQVTTRLGNRPEPLTYWTVVGDTLINGGNSKKLVEMKYALNNRIPDGMLVRVSSIDPDTPAANERQRQFAAAMVQAIAPEHRARFVGRTTPAEH